MAKHQHYPRDGLKHVRVTERRVLDGKFGKDVVGQGREGQGRQEGCPWLGKKGTYGHFISVFFALLSACLLIFPPQDRLQPLACKQTVRNKDTSSQVPGFCLKCEQEMQEMKSPSSLLRPVSAADFEQH